MPDYYSANVYQSAHQLVGNILLISGFESYMMGFNTSPTITWGKNTVSNVVGQNPDDPDFEFRAFYSYYAPSVSAVSYDEDWDSPNRIRGGALGAPAFVGVVTLH